MRILKLEFENLNSLKGSWSIDFTAPAFKQNHDIFVIHGPTGAGKTTILDAITLALYGCTPRLELITTASNEIMTRGTARCSASVTYQCKKGIFTSEFMQSRAYGKAGGALQAPSYKITAEDGSPVDMGKSSSALAKKTQELIQLDYTQFCRSIMLAQGAFSQFLTCGERERAQILEKLTGTERYRAIARRVYERYSELERAFTLKKSEREQILSNVLSDDEAERLSAEEMHAAERFADCEKTFYSLQKALDSYAEKERLEASFSEAERRAKENERAVLDFAPNLERLSAARRAKNVDSAYAVKKELERAQERDEGEKARTAQEQKQAEATFRQAEKASAEKSETLSACEKETESLRAIWTEVRALDTQKSAQEAAAREADARRASAQKALEQSTAELRSTATCIEALEHKHASLSAWRGAHSQDAELPGVIGKAEALTGKLAEGEAKLEALRRAEEAASEKARQAEAEKKEAEDAFSALEEEIKAFVSGEALCIIRELQKRLEPGKPCPVCAAVYRVKKGATDAFQGELDFSASAGKADSAQSDKSRTLSLTSAELNSRYEDAQRRVQTLSSVLEKARAEESHAKDAVQEEERTLTASREELRALCAPWQTTDVEALKALWQAWSENTDALTALERERAEKQAQKKACAEAVTSRGDGLSEREREAEAAHRALTETAQKRAAVFGDKDVLQSEAAQTRLLQAAKAEAAQCAKELQDAREARTRFETRLDSLSKSIAERSPKLEMACAAMLETLSENGFSDEAAFLASRMSEAEINMLTQQHEALQREQSEARAALAQCRETCAAFSKNTPLTEPKEAIALRLESVSGERTRMQSRLVEVRAKLSTNAQYVDAARKISAEYEALQKEHALWKRMKDFVGVKDGDDFSVFVQSIAFNSLLSLANRTLYSITKRYRIVQKAQGSLDFAISDDFYIDPRPITNLSGGEQFIVSLSLALAISKFASRAVRVDSLFLDEGFGTLSGDYLTEAINALKSLQKEGKMLGIITHVGTVISEIDQKIEVRPVSGGYSALFGDGITGSGS